MGLFRKSASAPPEVASSKRRRLWRRKKAGGQQGTPSERAPSERRRPWRRKKAEGQEGAPVKKKMRMPKPGLKLAEWRVQGAEKLAIARARLQERMSTLGHWLSYKLFAFTHPCSPFRRRAKRRSKNHSRIVAKERRMQKEHEARSNAAQKRGRIREKRISKDAERTKLLHNKS